MVIVDVSFLAGGVLLCCTTPPERSVWWSFLEANGSTLALRKDITCLPFFVSWPPLLGPANDSSLVASCIVSFFVFLLSHVLASKTCYRRGRYILP